MKHWNQTIVVMIVVAAGCLLSLTLAHAKKPDKPGGGSGGGGAVYVFIDLLGIENIEPDGSSSFFSSTSAVSEPDANGSVMVGGYAHLHPEESNHPVEWLVQSDGTFLITDLGLPPDASDASVSDNNDFGDLVINSVSQDNTAYALLSGQSPQPLADHMDVKAINNAGEIVGVANFNGFHVGHYWTIDGNGQVTPAVVLPDFQPNDINDLGMMVGNSLGRAAMAWFADGQLEVEPLTDAFNTTATAISNNGEWIVGQFAGEAFLWTEQTGIVGLGTLENYGLSYATSVNDSGEVVGWSDVHGKIGQSAYLFVNGQMHDLNQLVNVGGGLTLRYAHDINNAGHIVGNLVKSSKTIEARGFLLIPSN